MLHYTEITQNTLSKVERLRSEWPAKFESLTAVTHVLINKYILKLAGIWGFCNVKTYI